MVKIFCITLRWGIKLSINNFLSFKLGYWIDFVGHEVLMKFGFDGGRRFHRHRQAPQAAAEFRDVPAVAQHLVCVFTTLRTS